MLARSRHRSSLRAVDVAWDVSDGIRFALHVLKDIRPGEAFIVDLGDGHSVEVSVNAK